MKWRIRLVLFHRKAVQPDCRDVNGSWFVEYGASSADKSIVPAQLVYRRKPRTNVEKGVRSGKGEWGCSLMSYLW